ncbi:hypothetical protein HELRODRAFT_170274 [Helobdella robusta]|uniref:Uncharacterized protein n=1 Tax=Helobdella robusta TaxID=6412 RepID=T1F2V3_HELRO|nr:hypothetical protein HELRODRAFT_170274 [Helobdella robusta]ESO07730.1 hypothetical protein HELRODRAFT_170274 [Helobdella robusta]
MERSNHQIGNNGYEDEDDVDDNDNKDDEDDDDEDDDDEDDVNDDEDDDDNGKGHAEKLLTPWCMDETLELNYVTRFWWTAYREYLLRRCWCRVDLGSTCWHTPMFGHLTTIWFIKLHMHFLVTFSDEKYLQKNFSTSSELVLLTSFFLLNSDNIYPIIFVMHNPFFYHHINTYSKNENFQPALYTNMSNNKLKYAHANEDT